LVFLSEQCVVQSIQILVYLILQGILANKDWNMIMELVLDEKILPIHQGFRKKTGERIMINCNICGIKQTKQGDCWEYGKCSICLNKESMDYIRGHYA